MATARRSIETKHGMDMEARSAFVVDCDGADGARHPALLIDRDFAKRLGTSQPTVARWKAATAVSDAPVIPCPPANGESLNRVFRGVQHDDEGSPIWATSFDFTLHVSLKVQEYLGRKPSQATSSFGSASSASASIGRSTRR